MKDIRIVPINPGELQKLIAFDNQYFINMLKEQGVSAKDRPAEFTVDELEKAFYRKDILNWVFNNDELAGYFWFELKSDHLYIPGIVIKENFYGKGIGQYVLDLAEEQAKETNLSLCKLAVIPLNGRALNLYFKQGYKITYCLSNFSGSENPGSFHLIMEKNLLGINQVNTISERLTIICTDYNKLEAVLENGYIGTSISSQSDNNFENKIGFEKAKRI
jgi:ribosomal protein S18 acetylase RimI-like enzyme